MDKDNFGCFILGVIVTIFVLWALAMMSSSPCIKCGQLNQNTSIYCHECGTQLRVINKE